MPDTFPLSDLIECAEREVRQRQRVYPRLIATGKMTREKADRETNMMREIARRLRAEADANPQAAGRLV